MEKADELCIIDDDNIQVVIFKRLVEKLSLSHNATSYANGKEAFDNFVERRKKETSLPDIIFLDLNMPVWDGWTFYDEFIKEEHFKQTKIFILTSSLSQDDLDKAKERGLENRYICKPLDKEYLQEIVKTHLQE